MTDVSAPTFVHCPSSFDVILPPSSATVEVTWPIPMATSNEKFVSVVETNGISPPVNVGPGIHQIEYVAKDGEQGPQSYCRFTIHVKGL